MEVTKSQAVNIHDVTCVPFGQDATGRVASASILLTAPLVQGYVGESITGDYEYYKERLLLGREPGSQEVLQFRFDHTKAQSEEKMGQQLTCLILYNGDFKFALILRRVGQDDVETYERVGYTDLLSKATEIAVEETIILV